jgi:uncharacterized membrane protein
LDDKLVRILAAAFVIYSIVVTSISFAFLFVPQRGYLSIQHAPIESVVVRTPIEIKAEVEGGAGGYNVTLHYRIRSSNEWKIRQMLPIVRDGHVYLLDIPEADVTEPIDYQICVMDKSNTMQCTRTYTILVGDFYFIAYTTPTFYANQTSSLNIEIQSVNHFDRPVDLSISGLPSGVSATFEPSKATPIPSGRTAVKLNFRIRTDAPVGKYDLTVVGTYGSVTRSFTMTLSIPDFEIVVTPSSLTMERNEFASLTLTLRSLNGFDSDIRIVVEGYPNGVLVVVTQRAIRLNGGAVLVFIIETASSAETGTYNIVVSVIGGGRLNTFTIMLVIA